MKKWIIAWVGLCLMTVSGFGKPVLRFQCLNERNPEAALVECSWFYSKQACVTGLVPNASVRVMAVKGEPDWTGDEAPDKQIAAGFCSGFGIFIQYVSFTRPSEGIDPETGELAAGFYAIQTCAGGETSAVVDLTIDYTAPYDSCSPDPNPPPEPTDPDSDMLSLSVRTAAGTWEPVSEIIEVGTQVRWGVYRFDGASGQGVTVYEAIPDGGGYCQEWEKIEGTYCPGSWKQSLYVGADGSGIWDQEVPETWLPSALSFDDTCTIHFYAWQRAASGRGTFSPVISATFARFNTPPRLTMTAAPSAAYLTQPVAFRACATDAQDGFLTMGIVWYVDGQEQSAENLWYDNQTDEVVFTIPAGTLNPGDHKVEAVVSDVTGAVTKETVVESTLRVKDPLKCRRVSIRARGTPLGGVWPTMELWRSPGTDNDANTANDILIQSWPVIGDQYRTYQVDQDVDNVSDIWCLHLKFENDAHNGVEDRNLFVDYVKLTPIEGVDLPETTLYSTDIGVRYHVYRDEWDHEAWLPGQEGLYRNGWLDFPFHHNDYIDIKARARSWAYLPEMELYINNSTEPAIRRQTVYYSESSPDHYYIFRVYQDLSAVYSLYVKFINDDGPRDLCVDYVAFGDTVMQAESPQVIYHRYDESPNNVSSRELMEWNGKLIFDNLLPSAASRTQFSVNDLVNNWLDEIWSQHSGLLSSLLGGDMDGDGLSDGLEIYVFHTNPRVPDDTDGDGMPDGWELQYRLDRLHNDALGNPDGDEFPNLTEYWAGTRPNVHDTHVDSDGDGFSNMEEYFRWTDLQTADAAAWVEGLRDVSDWTSHNCALTSSTDGRATQVENGPDVWGKSWSYVGCIDVGICRYAVVNLSAVNGIAKFALSGPNDADYQEFASFTQPGRYWIDVSGWIGNDPGAEEVFAQLVLDGDNSSATYERLSLGRTFGMASLSPAPIARFDMDAQGNWESWNATWTSGGDGTSRLTEAGPDSWGKGWVYAGYFDVGTQGRVYLNLDDVQGSVVMAVSDAYDGDYQEFLCTTKPGEYMVDISEWIGNRAGSEYVFIQLSVVGEGAYVGCDEVAVQR
ncbi:MAG TPA: hypothetical protein DCZ95_16630 [Verrucomicrobia bacterium]|nr:hypothetical protein [Verrucomicrobiota bacterium]